jgi:hypothetical protein
MKKTIALFLCLSITGCSEEPKPEHKETMSEWMARAYPKSTVGSMTVTIAKPIPNHLRIVTNGKKFAVQEKVIISWTPAWGYGFPENTEVDTYASAVELLDMAIKWNDKFEEDKRKAGEWTPVK